eukprot:3414619-Pleurochrysis_carterae.AAC.1
MERAFCGRSGDASRRERHCETEGSSTYANALNPHGPPGGPLKRKDTQQQATTLTVCSFASSSRCTFRQQQAKWTEVRRQTTVLDHGPAVEVVARGASTPLVALEDASVGTASDYRHATLRYVLERTAAAAARALSTGARRACRATPLSLRRSLFAYLPHCGDDEIASRTSPTISLAPNDHMFYWKLPETIMMGGTDQIEPHIGKL